MYMTLCSMRNVEEVVIHVLRSTARQFRNLKIPEDGSMISRFPKTGQCNNSPTMHSIYGGKLHVDFTCMLLMFASSRLGLHCRPTRNFFLS